jgi:hypothetical protein
MAHKSVSSNLSKIGDKVLSRWDEAISEAKERIAELKRSIKTFESLRDGGMQFPEPKRKCARKGRNEANP